MKKGVVLHLLLYAFLAKYLSTESCDIDNLTSISSIDLIGSYVDFIRSSIDYFYILINYIYSYIVSIGLIDFFNSIDSSIGSID